MYIALNPTTNLYSLNFIPNKLNCIIYIYVCVRTRACGIAVLALELIEINKAG